MTETQGSAFRFNLGLNQPAESPTTRCLVEMAQAIGRETDGAVVLEVHPESRLGADPQMFKDVREGRLAFFAAGSMLSRIAPSTSLPLLPFAFTDSAAVFSALDGDLGGVIRDELSEAGLHTLGFMQNGFHHITTSTRPIETVADFAGMKIRSPGSAVNDDFWKTVGAESGIVPLPQMYDALKAGQFDGQTDPLGVVHSLRLNEVQTYLSMTSHWWSGFTLLAHRPTWEALPAHIQRIVSEAAARCAQAQRAEIEAYNVASETLLADAGMIVNQADTASFRAALGDFYGRWRERFTPASWHALEACADGLD